REAEAVLALPELVQPEPAREPNLREQAAHLVASMEITQLRLRAALIMFMEEFEKRSRLWSHFAMQWLGTLFEMPGHCALGLRPIARPTASLSAWRAQCTQFCSFCCSGECCVKYRFERGKSGRGERI